MLPGWVVFASAIGYLALLFAVASFGDRSARTRTPAKGRPLVYALSLAIYCTSWTYFGGVGLASQRGLEFAAIYIGPILMFTLGMPILRRIINLAKSEKIVSAADFVAARYGKNPTVAALVAFISLAGAIPYIALQLKAVSTSVGAMVGTSAFSASISGISFSSLPLLVTVFLAFFAIVFGTRHTDATEHQDGLMLAIAMETVIKLLAFCTAGIYVVFVLFDGPWDLFAAARTNADAMAALTYQTSAARWILLVVLSAFAIIMLPRQFHVTVVENRTTQELRMAGILFPLYLIAINIFVIPVAIAGVLTLNQGGNPDLYILDLPLHGGASMVSLITFIGGFSAATAMVIVASVALAIMISNDIVMPVILRRRLTSVGVQPDDYTHFLLRVRRTAIFAVLLLSYAYYRSTDSTAGLASIGLLSFAAIAQVAPSLFGGLIWHRANARGAIAGMTGGFFVWVYFLFLPSLGLSQNDQMAGKILAFLFPSTTIFDGPQADSLVNATLLSLMVNILLFVVSSLTRNAKPLERIQAGVFVLNADGNASQGKSWKTRISVGDMKTVIARYLGEERMQRSFATHERETGQLFADHQPADMALVHYSEQLLASAIGSSSARLVFSLLLQRMEEPSSETARLLDQASEALKYNQDMLHTALSQMDQGIAVFDTSNRLTIWNRRFRKLLDLPEYVGQVGYRLSDIVAILNERGDASLTGSENLWTDFQTLDKPFSLALTNGHIIEVRSNPMPNKGMVTTYTDITQQVAADKALKQANETLEQRVVARTGELIRVNRELALAQAAAEEANIGKTRFFAAAGHDILQPLNAARLYSSALVERLSETGNSDIVRNIDSSLESVEAILGAVLDISRLDTGAMKPRFSEVPLNDFLNRIETDFAPIAQGKNLQLRVLPTTLTVHSDPTLLRRLVQNLVSNAIKYTPSGKVLVGARRAGNNAVIQVVDSGIGIPQSKFSTVFKEFARLDEGARTASGLGLGLSIVDRIARVLDHPVELKSKQGHGTDFRVIIPLSQSPQLPAAAKPSFTQAAPSALTGLKVLCIDNEALILEGMRLLLSGWNCNVMTALSSSEALRLAKTEKPDVIVADYHLDDGTGIDAINEIRGAAGAAIPALLITADRTPEVRGLAETNAIAVQHKPLKPASLRAYLTRVATLSRIAAE
jgi:Na+/proline symporter/signal transduction histidine kinase/CheY-like chemotaxis protein